MSSELFSWLETGKLEEADKTFLTNIAVKLKLLEWASKDKSLNRERDKMRKDIEDTINEADIYWKCSGTQSEHGSDLSLEEWYLEDADAVVNDILSIVGDYIQEVL